MPAIRLVFWDWKHPVLDHAVDRLTQGWSGGALDLGHVAVIVPTSETGRRLREALAIKAAARHGAVTAPYVWHPASALTWDVAEEVAASGLQEMMAWSEVLRDLPAGEVTALLPVRPDPLDAAWVRGTAGTLRSLKHALGAGGHSMESVAADLVGEQDHARWCDLAELEARYRATLKRLGVVDAQDMKRALADAASVPAGVGEVLVMAVPDPPPLLLRWLKKTAEQVPVTVFVHAPSSQAAAFDEYGVPLLAAWGEDTGWAVPLSDEQLHIEASPREQATAAVGLLHGMVSAGLPPAIGACDPALNAHLEGALAAEGTVAFDPAGRTADRHAFVQLLHVWQRLAQSGMWRDVAGFLRQDDVLYAVKTEEAGASKLLKLIDKLHEEHLPPTLDDALMLAREDVFAPLRVPLTKMKALIEEWRASECTQAMRSLLEWLYGERSFVGNRDRDADYSKLFGEALRLAAELDTTRAQLRSGEGAVEMLGLLLDELGSTRLSDTRGEVDFVLLGWLELPWESSPGLVVTGFNEEHVPGIVTADPFLPDALRGKLGLASQASRRSRDAFLLRAMTEQRRSGGSLQIVLGRVDDRGDTQRPSRLLFGCPDAALVARVRHLFPKEEGGSGAPEPPAQLGFKLKPRFEKPVFATISPSAISSYLSCPFRFYLGNVLGMGSVDAAQREASPMDFGNLIHETLRLYALDESMADCMDGSTIARWLDAEVQRQWRAKFGQHPLLSVEMQLESARQRLHAAAEHLAKIRAEGWRTLHAERKVKDWNLKIGDLVFSGKMDRVDQHVTTKALRVWDYKTGSAKKPADAHLLKVEDDTPDWQTVQDAAGKEKRWADVQLPLYVWALRQKYPEVEVTAGYFNLPATVSDTGEKLWSELDEELVADALRTAGEVVQKIGLCDFWPPATEVTYDDYEMLLGDPLLTVDPINLIEGRAA